MVFKSGYVALIGRPNSGKSTLLNALIGEQLAIVTSKAQTTRHKITGILNLDDAQIVFLDTPGYHRSRKALNHYMNEVVDSVIGDADVTCLLVEADRKDLSIERGLFDRIGVKNCIVVINKADLISADEFEGVAKRIHDEWGAKEILVLSALKGLGVEALVDALKARMPEGEAFYPDDLYTDHPVRFIASEIIREKVFKQMQQEIPYSTAVEIEEYRDATEENPVTLIKAAVVVERDAQKAMVIGKGGKRIKEIGKKARQEIEELVDGKVFLEIFVRVDKDWTKDVNSVRQMCDKSYGK